MKQMKFDFIKEDVRKSFILVLQVIMGLIYLLLKTLIQNKEEIKTIGMYTKDRNPF